jgi:hypothetical protein
MVEWYCVQSCAKILTFAEFVLLYKVEVAYIANKSLYTRSLYEAACFIQYDLLLLQEVQDEVVYIVSKSLYTSCLSYNMIYSCCKAYSFGDKDESYHSDSSDSVDNKCEI